MQYFTNVRLALALACAMASSGCGRSHRADEPSPPQNLHDPADPVPANVPVPVPVPVPAPAPVPTPPPAPAATGTTYTETVGDVEIRVSVPASLPEGNAMRAAFYLHGDTASDYFNERYAPLRAFAAQQHMLFVAALAPNRDSWWKETRFAAAFADVVARVEQQYALRGPHLYAGVSGGSTFLTMLFIPRYGNVHPGTVAAMCGGARPRNWAFAVTPEIRAANPLYFTYGSKDYLADPNGYYGDVIHASIKGYEDLGFGVTETVIPDKTHCAFEWRSEILKVWRARQP